MAKKFNYRFAPSRIDGMRVIANLGEMGSVQRIETKLDPEREYQWSGASSIIVSGAVFLKFDHGKRVVLRPGDVLPSVIRYHEGIVQEALENGTLIYCLQHKCDFPIWNKGFVLEPGRPLLLGPRKKPSRLFLASGYATCNETVDLDASVAPHLLKVSAGKRLSISGDGVLLYMFESEADLSKDPALDIDPLVDDYMKGLRILVFDKTGSIGSVS